jgi:hypothetical protein
MAAKNITAFSFASPAATGAINGTDISVVVPVGTDVTALIATFTHTGASIAVDGVAQVSGVTANDFTDAVVYTVTATDATTQDFTVRVWVTQVSVADIAQLRRMVAESTTATYSDAALTRYIEKYPHLDEQGEEPYTLSSDSPPVQEVNTSWIPTYDLHAAAGDIWEEKAAAVVDRFDFNADGGNYSVSQRYEQRMALCRFHRAHRMPSSMRMVKSPDEGSTNLSWIVNLAE